MRWQKLKDGKSGNISKRRTAISGARCKAAVDCTGEIQEAVTKAVDLILHGYLSEDAVEAFNEMKEDWAEDYRKWKRRFIDFED